MNQEKNPSSPPAKKLPVVFYVAIALLAVIILIFWRHQSAMKERLQELAEQNTALEEQLTAARSRPAQPRRTEPATDERQATFTAEPQAPPPETIKLLTPAIETTPAGLTARLEFEPDSSAGTPELIALVVRIPKEAGARIVAFDAVNETDYSDIRKRVDESGTFAIFQGSPGALETLRFDLTVSGPVTATVRGSKGIRAFEITLGESGPAVRRL